jgi:hypothetical protein
MIQEAPEHTTLQPDHTTLRRGHPTLERKHTTLQFACRPEKRRGGFPAEKE